MKHVSSFSKLVILIIILAVVFNCKQDKNNQNEGRFPSMELVPSSSSGIDFINTLNDDPLGEHNILSYPNYYHGGGVGLGDFDNDGLVDVFFAGNEVPNKIYKNLGNLKFEDLSDKATINEHKNWATGCSVIDINNDGLLDIYVSQSGPEVTLRKNLFYINKGNFVFKESAKEMGVDDGNISTQAVFLDFDKDGDLDLYVLNESKYILVILATIFEELKDKNNLRAASGKFYRNDGNGTFVDITENAGLLEHSYGLGVVVSDFNNDNYPDIYVSNDFSVPDKMYINQKDGTFKDEVKSMTNSISYFSMGCDVADINNDGFNDIAVVDMATADHFRGKTLMESMDSDAFNYYTKKLNYHFQYMFNAFQLNNGNGTYSNIAGITGLQKTDWSWSVLLADLNLDGKRDYFVTNGYKKYNRDNDWQIMIRKVRAQNNGEVPESMKKEIYAKMPSIELRNLIYMNEGDFHFVENPDYYNYPDVGSFSYGAAYGDLDNDGDLDFVVNNIDSPAHILKNNARENNLGNYLTLKLSNKSNSALTNAAKVKISYGDEFQVAENSFVRGYVSTMDQRLFFGLNQIKKVDKIEILWPDGNLQTIENITANQQLDIEYKKEKQGNLEFNSKSNFMAKLSEISSSSLNINYKHDENPYEDFAKEVLLPQRQSTLGPGLAVGDVNKDGLDDIFCGAATGQVSTFYMQNADGTFSISDDTYFKVDKFCEDLDAVFIDPNKDGLKELFIASGGGGDVENGGEILHDRIYTFTNNTFAKLKNVAPEMATSTGKVVAGDLNNDGIDELLICGTAKPGKYPISEPTRLLSYSNNKYQDVTESLMPEANSLSIVRDGVFTDVNKDGLKDIITVSEWGTPQVFIGGKDGKLKNETALYIKQEMFGWWVSITSVDIDNDGDEDYILGNFGENLKHKVSEKKPLYLYANDFDKNGTIDVVLAKEYKGKIVPARGKECSTEQMPFIAQKFESYTSFANADLVEILGEKSVEESSKFKATTFGSYLLRNNGGSLSFEKLPAMAQFAPASSTVIYDINKDGFQDIIIAGNYYDTEYETPRQDAGRGLVLINNQGKSFTVVPPYESGLNLNGNFREIRVVQRKNDKLLVGIENNGGLKFYKLP